MDNEDFIEIAQDLSELEFFRKLHEADMDDLRLTIIKVRSAAREAMVAKMTTNSAPEGLQ